MSETQDISKFQTERIERHPLPPRVKKMLHESEWVIVTVDLDVEGCSEATAVVASNRRDGIEASFTAAWGRNTDTNRWAALHDGDALAAVEFTAYDVTLQRRVWSSAKAFTDWVSASPERWWELCDDSDWFGQIEAQAEVARVSQRWAQ